MLSFHGISLSGFQVIWGLTPVFFYWGVVPACHIHCTCLSVFPLSILCLPCLLWTVPSLNSGRECFQKLSLFQKHQYSKQAGLFGPGLVASSVCPCLLPLLFCLFCSAQVGGGQEGTAPGRDRRQAVSRLGLPMHSLSFTELEHCFAVLYL